MTVVRKCSFSARQFDSVTQFFCNTGRCTCEGWLAGSAAEPRVCNGCNSGATVRRLDICTATAQQWDHTSAHLRKDVEERGRWASDLCTCDGACAIVDKILGVGRLAMPPSQLQMYPCVWPDNLPCENPKNKGKSIFAWHMCCVARSLCCECRLCFTGYRATWATVSY